MAQVRLADGKVRKIQHITATSYWGADGKPLSAAQFLEALFGALPAFFRHEDELRELWSVPDTRKALLAGLAEKGFGRDALREMWPTFRWSGVVAMIAARSSILFLSGWSLRHC